MERKGHVSLRAHIDRVENENIVLCHNNYHVIYIWDTDVGAIRPRAANRWPQ
jgi:hypothetical protein